MTLPSDTKVANSPPELCLLGSQLKRAQLYLSSKLSSSPLTRVSLRPLSFVLSLASPIAAAVDSHIDGVVHRCMSGQSHITTQPFQANEAATRDNNDADRQSILTLPSLDPPLDQPELLQSPIGVAGGRMLVGAVWERHVKDELVLSNIAPDKCLQAFYNASCHCFLDPSSTPFTAISSSPLHSTRSALTFVNRLRSSLRSAWHPDLLPVAISFYQLACRHLQHHSLLFPAPSPFPFFLSDSFREHFFALHASIIRAVYDEQLSAVCPAVYQSLERICASPTQSASLRALENLLSASPALSPLIPHISHALHRIHHQQQAESLSHVQPSTALVLSTSSPTAHLTLSSAMWSTVDSALARWREAVQRGCLALHECVRVIEEESARRGLSEHDDTCLELDHDQMLLIALDDSDDDEVDKQLAAVHSSALTSLGTSSSSSPTSLSQQLQRYILSSLKRLTAAPFSSPRASSASPPSPPLSPSSPALRYHLSHLHNCLTSLHHHLLHYLLSSPLLNYPADLLAMARESALCVLGSEKERVGELEYGGLIGKLYEVLRAFSETVAAVQCAQ